MRFSGELHRRQVFTLLGAAAFVALDRALAQGSTLRLGVLRLASAGAVFIATEKGYFSDEGVDVDLKFFDAAQRAKLKSFRLLGRKHAIVTARANAFIATAMRWLNATVQIFRPEQLEDAGVEAKQGHAALFVKLL